MAVRKSSRPSKAPERLVEMGVTKPPKGRRPRRIKLPRIKGQPPSLSRLESLPSEILQEICLLSDNHFLPNASAILGVKLSCEHIYMHFCFQGFFCYDNNPPSPIHQAWLFSRHCMDWNVFQKYANKAYEEYSKRLHDGGTRCKCSKSHGNPSSCFIRNEWSRFREPEVRPPILNPSDDDTGIFHPYLSPIICRIPPKLLHGPFPPDKIAFLRFLTTNRVMVDNTMNRKGRTFVSAWQEALRLDNYDSVSLLLSHRLKWAVQPVGHDLMDAIEFHNTPKPILKILIEKMVQRRDFNFADPDTGLADCIRKVSIQDGDDRGWLLEWIRQAAA